MANRTPVRFAFVRPTNGRQALPGMHGYHPGHKDSVAAFMANVPDTAKPALLEDMDALMHAEAAGEVVE